MTLFYPDISSYQSGISLNGMAAVVVKATEGTTYTNPDYARVASDATARGIPWAAYHFLHHTSDPAAQARHYYAVAGGTPAMIDVETAGDGTNATVGDTVAFANALKQLGGNPRLVYLPHWYWQELGSPSLTPLADAGLALVSSNYTTYSDTGPGWTAYGGVTPSVWQYTDAHQLNGFAVDYNAYRGTVDEFRALLEGDEMLDLNQVIPTAATSDVPNRNLGQVLGDNWHDAHIGMYAQFAGVNAKLDAMAAAIQTLAGNASNVDTAAVLDAINKVGQTESQTVSELRQEVENLQAKLATTG